MPEPEHPSPTAADQTSFPPGLHHAWRFALFNGLSFPLVLGSPMFLYAKTLHASATVLGIIAGMMPLLVMFQIPAASYINRIGFKRFVLAGWSTRVLFSVGMACVPLTAGFLDVPTRLVLVLALLFAFNLVRGISSCAWLPWITALVPDSLRGKYVSRDAAMSNLGCFLAVLAAAATLGESPHAGQFSGVFAFSALTGVISLVFLKRIPDVAISEEARTSREPVPWLAMLRHPPFRKLLRSVVAWSVAYGGLTAFTVAYLKTETGLSEGTILLVTSVAFLGGLSSLWFLGSRLDHLGSKPVMSFALAVWILILGGWMALAGGAWAARLPVIIALQFLMGLFAALVAMSNNRLAMAIIPPLGRNHFFALYSVFANVALGLAPIAWGLLIDAIGHRHARFLGLDWNRYTFFYAAAALVFAISLALARRLEEPKAASLEALLTEMLIASPQRLWLRFWPRS
jgi:MFS family permease